MRTTLEVASGHSVAISRRWPIGAEVRTAAVDFRVWAPSVRSVEVALVDPDTRDGGERIHLQLESGGYFHGTFPGIGAGALYGFSLDDGEKLFPDPASRFQPFGPHGPSQVV